MFGRRGKKELFELLREEKRRKSNASPAPVPQDTPDLEEAGPCKRHDVVLKQETCIFGAIILLLLLILAFILGYYKAKNEGITGTGRLNGAAMSGVDDGPSILPAISGSSSSGGASSSGGDEQPRPRPVPVVSGNIYALRVWTGGKGATKSAAEIVRFLKKNNLGAWTKVDREGIKILIGRFKSKSAPAALRTRNQVRILLYKGSRAFHDCYFVKVK